MRNPKFDLIIMTLCFCGSIKQYSQCCGTYHQNCNAPTAVDLMKSRYSAFCIANIDYIAKTMHKGALIGFNGPETKRWAESVCWLGLEIVNSFKDQGENKAFVEFIARYLIKDRIEAIHEISEFEYWQNQWFYIAGTAPNPEKATKTIKISRNTPCPCRSGKKFKNCHGDTSKV